MNTLFKFFGLIFCCTHSSDVLAGAAGIGYRFTAPIPAIAPSYYSAPAYPTSYYAARASSAYLPSTNLGPSSYSYLAAAAAAAAPQLIYSAPKFRTGVYVGSGSSKKEFRDDSGQYSFGYLKPSGSGYYVPVKEGTYAYTSPEGTPVSFDYRTDANGYQVKGYLLPIAPNAESKTDILAYGNDF